MFGVKTARCGADPDLVADIPRDEIIADCQGCMPVAYTLGAQDDVGRKMSVPERQTW